MKIKSQKELLKLSPAELDQYMADVKAHLSGIAPVIAENRTKQLNEVGVALDDFLPSMSKILGREINMGELAAFARQRAAGTLGKLVSASSVPGGNPADKGKRLSDETKAAVRADLLARGVALRTGKAAEQLTVIAVRHGIATQTLDGYKPTSEQIDAEVARLAATVAAPAPAAS